MSKRIRQLVGAALSAVVVICAALVLCRTVPLKWGMLFTFVGMCLDFAFQAYCMYKDRKKVEMICYIITVVFMAALIIYQLCTM